MITSTDSRRVVASFGLWFLASSLVTRLCSAAPSPAAVEVARGVMNIFRYTVDADRTHGLPINEIKQSQIDAAEQLSSGFVPAQLGNFLAIAALGNAWRAEDPSFTSGYTDRELITIYQAAMTSIEGILADASKHYNDAATGKKSFYQFYGNDGSVGNDGFSRIVSMLDCSQAIVGMHVAEQYLRNLKPANLDAGVTLSETQALADRFHAALAQFSLRMWLDDFSAPTANNYGLLYFGDPNNPRSGAVTDRIINEGRLAWVAGLARGEISQTELEYGYGKMVRATPQGSSTRNSTGDTFFVERRAYFGAGLEIYSISPFITSELRGPFGEGSLFAYVDAWIATADNLGIPGAGHSNISTGLGFKEFGMSPLENSPHPDNLLIIPPGNGMMVGSTFVPPYPFWQDIADRAVSNLVQMVTYLKANDGWDNTYGASNYKDIASGQVDPNDRTYGSLEMAEMALGLLNGFLGGRYLENLLAQDPGWFNALRQHQHVLNLREVEFKNTPVGTANTIFRGGASASHDVRLEGDGSATSNDCLIGEPGDYEIILRYSNSGTRADPSEIVEVSVNGQLKGNFITQDSGDWSVFIESPPVSIGFFAIPQIVNVQFKLASGDYFGVEPDSYRMVRRSLAVSSPSPVVEGNAGTKDVEFMISLVTSSATNTTVDYATADGTATAGEDYEATSGSLTFAAGETTKRVGVHVRGDTTGEPNETFTLVLSSAAGASLDGPVGTATIIDDDPNSPPVLGNDRIARSPNIPAKVRVSKLLSNDSDPEGASLILTGVSPLSDNGVPVEWSGDWVYYHAVIGQNADDHFSYTASDGLLSATATVNVVTELPAGVTLNLIGVTPGVGQLNVRVAAIPGRSYQLQQTGDLTTPAIWNDVGLPQIAPPDGQLLLTDPSPASPRFYRVLEIP